MQGGVVVREAFPADHYYWLTSELAVRGLQRRVCRIICAIIVLSGAVPLAMIGNAAGPQTTFSKWAAVGIFVCCAIFGAMWLRARWPTRLESQACGVAGTICVSVACLTAPDPVIGLLSSSIFSVVVGFTILFHNLRLLAVVTLGVMFTATVLTARVAVHNALLASSSVVIVVGVIAFAAVCSLLITRLVDIEVRRGDIDPLTGLMVGGAFYESVATLIAARSREQDRYLVVIVAGIDNLDPLESVLGSAAANRIRVQCARYVRETVRRETIVGQSGDGDFLIAEVFTHADPTPLAERLSSCADRAGTRLGMSVGVVSTPLPPLVGHEPYPVIDEVLALASAAKTESRQMGGNAIRCVLSPTLKSIHRPDGG